MLSVVGEYINICNNNVKFLSYLTQVATFRVADV